MALAAALPRCPVVRPELSGDRPPVPCARFEVLRCSERHAVSRKRPLSDSVEAGGALLPVNCHFFTAEEIELDLDPTEVLDERSLQPVTALLVELGRLLGKRVILSYENSPPRRGVGVLAKR